jgi:hypothetical protein
LRNALRRIGLSFVSLLLAVVLFSLLSSSAGPLVGWILPIFRVTMMCALPVWCLYLPVVIAVQDAEGRRIWTILSSGSLIGPVLLGLWGLVLEQRGGNHEMIWHGDLLLGVLGGDIAGMIFSLIVGCLTTSFYVIALRVLHRRSVASYRRSA